jgi:ketosteroid isomerase-like protein
MTTGKFAAVWVALAASALAGCSASADTGKIAEGVQKDALGLVAAYNAQDAHAAAAYDAPDYVGVFHDQSNTVGPAADEASMKAQMKAAKVEWALGESNVTVAQSGDLAVFEAPYTFTVTPADGQVVHESGNWIAIFRKQPDGQMKLWRSIGSNTPPPVPVQRAEPL